MKRKILSALLAISMLTAGGAFAPALAEEETLSLETVIEPQYEAVAPFTEGLAAVKQNGLWGYINETGDMVIQPKYQTANEFHNNEAVVAFEDGTMQAGEQSIYILRDDCKEIPLTAPGYNAGGYWDQQAAIHYNPKKTTLDNMRNHNQDGVVVAGGSAYLPDGTRIEPEYMGMDGLTPRKATDFGFCQNYQDYMVLGPSVNGIIPCKALFYNKESFGQCFFMDKAGKILNVFRSLDQGEDEYGYLWGITSCFAPDPETGLIPMRFSKEPSDSWTFVNDIEHYADFRSITDRYWFRNFIIRDNGSVWSQNTAVAQKRNGKIVLIQYRNGNIDYLDNKEYTDATMFSEGYCSVNENGSWHFVDANGKSYGVSSPDGYTTKATKITALGLFQNGIAPVYDEVSGKFYLISRKTDNDVFLAVQGSDNIAADVYFPGFTPGEETSAFMGFVELGSLIAIEKDGKYGFAKLKGSVDPGPDPKPGFIDVVPGSYYEDAVTWAVNHDPQITNGTSDTTFSPDQACTRGQVVTFLWRANGAPEPTTSTNPFKDVDSKAFYYKAVLWAVENGITQGTSSTTFDPGKACTRGQVVTFLHRTVGEPAPTKTDCPFTDVNSGAFYYTAMLWAVENNVTKGMTATTFAPNAECTRGQIVTFLYRALK